MPTNERTIQIGKREFVLQRFGLKRWMELEKLREAISEAASAGNTQGTEEALYGYLLAASDAPQDWLTSAPWMDVALLYTSIVMENECHADVPLLKVKANMSAPLPWDYPLRNWYSLAHLLASKYSWTLETIAELDPDDVFPLVQEILTDEQLEREFYHSLSEVSYPYNKATKSQDYKPLPRPDWMVPPAPKIKMIKWPTAFLPVGNVVDLSGMLNREQKQH